MLARASDTTPDRPPSRLVRRTSQCPQRVPGISRPCTVQVPFGMLAGAAAGVGVQPSSSAPKYTQSATANAQRSRPVLLKVRPPRRGPTTGRHTVYGGRIGALCRWIGALYLGKLLLVQLVSGIVTRRATSRLNRMAPIMGARHRAGVPLSDVALPPAGIRFDGCTALGLVADGGGLVGAGCADSGVETAIAASAVAVIKRLFMTSSSKTRSDPTPNYTLRQIGCGSFAPPLRLEIERRPRAGIADVNLALAPQIRLQV